MKKIVQTIYPSLIWTGIIFWLLTMDSSRSGRFRMLRSIPQFDKFFHSGVFVFFSIFWISFFAGHTKKEIRLIAFIIFCVGSVYGMGLEFYQLYFTNRSFSWLDGFANAVGAALGAWVATKKPLWK